MRPSTSATLVHGAVSGHWAPSGHFQSMTRWSGGLGMLLMMTEKERERRRRIRGQTPPEVPEEVINSSSSSSNFEVAVAEIVTATFKFNFLSHP